MHGETKLTSFRAFIGVLVAGSMFGSSSVAVAARSAAPAAQVNPWAALTALSGGAASATLCSAAAATATVAQAPGGCVLPVLDAAPPVVDAGPPPPVPVPALAAPSSFGISPILLGLAAVAAGVGLYLALRDKGGPNSPS